MAEIRDPIIPLDTSPSMANRQFEMLMALSAERRVGMAASMFDSARHLMLAEFAARGIPEERWPGEIFRRTYAPDFDAESLNRIAEQLDRRHRRQSDASRF